MLYSECGFANMLVTVTMTSSVSLYAACSVLMLETVYGMNESGPGAVSDSAKQSNVKMPGEDEREQKRHQMDSLNLLMFVSLLILTVLTIWMFKHIRLRYVHETGLAVVYGLIVGCIIKYTSSANSNPISYAVAHLSYNMSESLIVIPPDYLKVRVTDDSNSTYYHYSLVARSAHSQSASEPGLDEMATFDPEVFFNVLLPPIIFNAGYSMKRKHFFKNFGAISAYAFLGTIVSSFAVGGIMFAFTQVIAMAWSFNDCLMFGAIISATDPVTVLAIFNDLNVDVDLYALVFGESVLNDAVAIILVSSIQTYQSDTHGFDGMAALRSLGNFLGVLFGGFAVGAGMGCVTALMTKYTHIRDYPLLETSLFFMMSYCTFLASEVAGMTGIVAVLFCGICQAHYTYNNLSTESKARTKQIFELLNFLMENFVFAYIGVSIFTFKNHHWNVPFIIMSFFAIIIGRACNVYPLSALLNLGRSNKIQYKFQHLMMFSGLRGAMAFALAIRNTDTEVHQTIFSTTLVIVIATVILCGGSTMQMLLWLKIRVGIDEDKQLHSFESVRTSPSEQRLAAAHTNIDLYPSRLAEKARLVRIWYNFDAKFMKPLLTHAWPPLTETLPRCFIPLTRLLTTEQQSLQPNLVGSEQAEDSDTELVDDHELNYGERSETNYSHSNGEANQSRSLFSNNHSVHAASISRSSQAPLIDASLDVQPMNGYASVEIATYRQPMSSIRTPSDISRRERDDDEEEDDDFREYRQDIVLPTRVKIPGTTGDHV